MISLGKPASNDLSLRKLTPVPFIIENKTKKKKKLKEAKCPQIGQTITCKII